MLVWPLLAQAGRIAGKAKGKAESEGVWKYIDAANEFVKNANFEEAIRSPAFWGVSVVLLAIALFRGWKGFLVMYVGGVALWGIVHFAILKDTTTGAGSSNILVFAALTVGVAGLGIYFLLIRD